MQIVAEADFEESQIDSVVLVIAVTEDRALNRRISDAAQARHRLVNVVDDQPLCLVYLPVDCRPLAAAGGDLLWRISPGAGARAERKRSAAADQPRRMAEKASYWRNHLKTRLTSVTNAVASGSVRFMALRPA